MNEKTKILLVGPQEKERKSARKLHAEQPKYDFTTEESALEATNRVGLEDFDMVILNDVEEAALQLFLNFLKRRQLPVLSLNGHSIQGCPRIKSLTSTQLEKCAAK